MRLLIHQLTQLDCFEFLLTLFLHRTYAAFVKASHSVHFFFMELNPNESAAHLQGGWPLFAT